MAKQSATSYVSCPVTPTGKDADGKPAATAEDIERAYKASAKEAANRLGGKNLVQVSRTGDDTFVGVTWQREWDDTPEIDTGDKPAAEAESAAAAPAKPKRKAAKPAAKAKAKPAAKKKARAKK